MELRIYEVFDSKGSKNLKNTKKISVTVNVHAGMHGSSSTSIRAQMSSWTA